MAPIAKRGLDAHLMEANGSQKLITSQHHFGRTAKADAQSVVREGWQGKFQIKISNLIKTGIKIKGFYLLGKIK